MTDLVPPRVPIRSTEGQHAHETDLRVFQGTEAWVFDLDNTLYPHEINLFEQVDEKIRHFVATNLGVPESEAETMQRAFYRDYGTTLRGLMMEHNIDVDAFLEAVHDIDHTLLTPNPRLEAAIRRLPGRKFIFTNGSRKHAENVASRLGITAVFEDIFDIVAAKLMPKPNRETYDLFVETTGISPARAAMFEDLSRNLVVPHGLGMHTILLVPRHTREIFAAEWELEGDNAPHVEFVTDDLAGFVEAVAAVLEST
jgi:putative hydrolase of the HAD superfamily